MARTIVVRGSTPTRTQDRHDMKTYRNSDLQDVPLPSRNLAHGADGVVCQCLIHTMLTEIVTARKVVRISQEAIAAEKERECQRANSASKSRASMALAQTHDNAKAEAGNTPSAMKACKRREDLLNST